MFFEKKESSPDDAIKALLEPYLHLDKSLFKGEDDGLACAKKFSNQSRGISLRDSTLLSQAAADISKGVLHPENWLEYVDVLTLYSNHLDQQRFGDMPPKKEKEERVLHFLEAAYQLSPKYDYAHLERYTPRELSSHAQLLHYLGKAQRYAAVPVEARFVHIENALAIAKHLAALKCVEAEDPHHYKGRIATYELVVSYCLQDMHRYDEAIALLKPQLDSANPFHITQAHVQLANAYVKKYQHEGVGMDEALHHARSAVAASMRADNSLLRFNARVVLMDTLQAADQHEAASTEARTIIADMETPDCGAKDLHREAALKVLAANESLSAGCAM